MYTRPQRPCTYQTLDACPAPPRCGPYAPPPAISALDAYRKHCRQRPAAALRKHCRFCAPLLLCVIPLHLSLAANHNLYDINNAVKHQHTRLSSCRTAALYLLLIPRARAAPLLTEQRRVAVKGRRGRRADDDSVRLALYAQRHADV